MANAMGEEFFFYPADSKKKREELKPYLEKQGRKPGSWEKQDKEKGSNRGRREKGYGTGFLVRDKDVLRKGFWDSLFNYLSPFIFPRDRSIKLFC